MQIRLLDVVAASDGHRVVSGADLGGRRARIILAALALSDHAVSTDTLARAIWGEHPPTTWPIALRGAVRALRIALAPIGGDGERVIGTVPSGYCLAADVEVDVTQVQAAVRRSQDLLTQGRFSAALESAEPAAAVRGASLLPGEDGEWLTAHRDALDAAALRALDVMVSAASALGHHATAVDAGRRAAALAPLDERIHRSLLRALAAAGDRAGAVLAFDTCRSVLADELGIDPSPETVSVYLASALDQAPVTTAPIPRFQTAFFGRGDEIEALHAQFVTPGVITVVGPGGVGKSRLVAQAINHPHPRLAASWVPLSSVAEDALVAVTTALHLDVDAPADPTPAIGNHLAPQGRRLLVLDGADLVTDGVASMVVQLMQTCPDLTIVVTSRFALGVDHERLLAIEPLAAPEAGTALADNPQIALLRDRLVAAGGVLDDHVDASDLIALCERCDGLPLALELAAAQLKDMSPSDLLDELGEARHDRLRQVAAASYAQLEADEAAVFRRFGVLDGPVPLSFARAVVASNGVAPQRVVRILRELGTRGLVTVDRSVPHWTYSQDDDIHRYAVELLDHDGATAAAYNTLGDALRGLLPEDPREPPAPYADAVTAVLGSVRSLLTAGVAGHADGDRCLELAFRLHRYWAATSVAEGRRWLGQLLAPGVCDPQSPWRSYATYALGYLGYWAGDTDAALHYLRQAVELFGDQPTPFLARALIYTAGLLDDQDQPEQALKFVRRSMSAAEPFGTDLYVAAAMGLGSVLSERADPRAAQYAAEAVARCRADGSTEQLAALLPTAAMVCWQVGAVDQARTYVTDAWPLHRDNPRIARVVLLSAAAGIAYADRDIAAALDHGRSADREGQELGVEREMPLIRAVLARSLLRAGDVAASADRALAGIEVAARMQVRFPLAVGLETAALVGATIGADAASLAALVGTAGRIRARGDRPPPVPFARDLDAVAAGPAIHIDRAVALAREILDAARG